MEKRNIEQFTEEQAIALSESCWWEVCTADEIVRLQLYQERLCMPFPHYQRTIEKVLGRPVYLHEFMDPDALIREYEGSKTPPTFDEIVAMIPSDKLVVIVHEDPMDETCWEEYPDLG